MKDIIKIIKKRKILYTSMFVLFMGVIAINLMSGTFSLLQPVRSVEIFSNNVSYQNNEPGSWKVTKSARWTGSGKARITVDVDTILKTGDNQYKDIIMVLDISGSMTGNKLTRVKEDSIELINSVLANSNNKVALISFESNSTLISGLTNDKNALVNYINDLSATGCTNYYKALLNVEEILKNYTKESNRDCIVMFLTDGYPNEGTPNQIGEYNYLKSAYPYVTFNGIQYEMGNTVLDPIKEISDNQWIADMDTLNNVLFDASVAPLIYEEFKFTDYIDTNYFNISSIDNIKTKVGTTTLDNNKITWTIKNSLKSGDKASLTIDITLKNEYLNEGGTYPTNSSETITSKIDTNNENVTSSLTPVLQDNYMVTYDGNAPSGCNVSNVPNAESKSVYTNVLISDTKPTCSGYAFKKWEIITENVEKVNGDYFIMPEVDVTLRAVWSKLSLSKSMIGKVTKAQTLYDMMADQAVMDNKVSAHVKSSSGINFENISSDENGKGVYERVGTENATNPIYYYRGNVDDNNVIFADTCWKMVITTETGGVKMIYNGVPVDGKCNNTGTATQIGTKEFNYNSNSPADVGYMYGTRYISDFKDMNWYSLIGKTKTSKTILTIQYGIGTTNYYYADYAVWDGSQYVLYNSNDLTDTTAAPVTKYTWSSNYNKLKGKYTCVNDTSTTCTTVRYISGGSSFSMYYVTLSANSSIDDYRVASNTVRYTEEDGYTLTNPVSVAKLVNGNNWLNQYNNYKGYYFCGGTNELNTTTCDTVYYIASGYDNQATVVSLTHGETYDNLANQELLFGNSVDSSGNLQNTIPIKIKDWSSTGYKAINNNHYTCFNTTGTCTSNVYYVYYTSSSFAYSIILPIGKTIDVALSEMLDYNDNLSAIMGDKTNPASETVNYWYYNNIENKNDENGNSFSDYIEDTPYCNDRSILSLGGFEPNGGTTYETSGTSASTAYYLYFGSYGRASDPSVTCPRNIDKLTVASGYLKYPTGLLTIDEIRLAGAADSTNYNHYLWNGVPGSNSPSIATYWWSVSPRSFNGGYASEWDMGSYGWMSNDSVVNMVGVRPVISIKPGTRTIGGDGTRDNPYIVEVREAS